MLTLAQVSTPTKIAFKRALFPGLDLHTRCRYRFLPRLFRAGVAFLTLALPQKWGQGRTTSRGRGSG